MKFDKDIVRMVDMDTFKSAVILAGGQSSRMKFDKQFLVINEKRLIYDIANKLECSFDEIIIVSNKKEYYRDSKYNIVSDEVKDMGPLAGIHVGLNESNSKYVYITACDMPNIDNKYIENVKVIIEEDISYSRETDLYLSKINNQVELFQGFYKKDLAQEILDYLINGSKKSIRSFYKQNNKSVTYVNSLSPVKESINSNIFVNLNTSEDLKLYENNIKTLRR